MRVIEFIKKYWGTAKEIVLVLAAVLYFAIGFRLTPLVDRINAVERDGKSDRKTLEEFIVATNKRFESNEATIHALDTSNAVNRQNVKSIKDSVDRLLNLHIK